MSDYGESNVEMLNYMLYEESPEMHQMEVDEERWYLELGERPASDLVFCKLGSHSHFMVHSLWPYLYRVDGRFRRMMEDESPLYRRTARVESGEAP